MSSGRPTRPTGRLAPSYQFVLIWRIREASVPQKWCIDSSGRHGVDSHGRARLECSGTGNLEHSALRSTVGRTLFLAANARDRCDAHDPSRPWRTMVPAAHFVAKNMERTLVSKKVRVVFFARGQEGTRQRDTGVVDEDVEAS